MGKGSTTDPKQFMDLISILGTYIELEESVEKPYLVKDGIKIIL